jgi:hypothetical protein
LLAGDELYPEIPDVYGTQNTDDRGDLLTKSYMELCDETRRMHRQVLTKDGNLILLCNCEMPCGHIPPYSREYRSKL